MVAVDGMVCLGFLVVDLAGRFSGTGAHSRSSGRGRFFVRCRPRLEPVGLEDSVREVRSLSSRFEPLRLRVVVEEGRIVFRKIE